MIQIVAMMAEKNTDETTRFSTRDLGVIVWLRPYTNCRQKDANPLEKISPQRTIVAITAW